MRAAALLAVLLLGALGCAVASVVNSGSNEDFSAVAGSPAGSSARLSVSTLSHPGVQHVQLQRKAGSHTLVNNARKGHPDYVRLVHARNQLMAMKREKAIMAAKEETRASGRHASATLSSTAYGKTTLTGCPFSDFTIPTLIGGTNFELLVDTGSSTLALVGAACSTCTGVTPKWTATSSSTPTPYTSEGLYGDNTGWLADVWTDSVSLASSSSSTAGSAAPATTMNIAVINAQSTTDHDADGTYNPDAGNFFVDDHCIDNDGSTYQTTIVQQGIIGLGFQNLAAAHTDSFIAKMFAQHASISPIFAMQMCEGSGNLWIGGSDTSYYKGDVYWTPVTEAKYWTVQPSNMYLGGKSLDLTNVDFPHTSTNIIDSGTTLWALPASVYDLVRSVLNSDASFNQYFDDSIWDSNFCLEPKGHPSLSTLQKNMPTISVQFANGMTITMDGVGSYLLPCDHTYGHFVSGLSRSDMFLAGWPLMNQFVTVHDMTAGQERIGFAPTTNCAKGTEPHYANATYGDPPPFYGLARAAGSAAPVRALVALLLLAVVAAFTRL